VLSCTTKTERIIEQESMKTFFTISFLALSLITQAQITILSGHLPNAGDTMVTRNATLLSDVDLEATGANHTWDFGFDILQPDMLNAGIPCRDVNDTPFGSQIFFNNPFDPDHNSDFAIGVESFTVGTITLEDAYQYYKNSGNVYSVTGLGLSFSGIPVVAQNNDTDVLYDLPLNYDMNGASTSSLAFDIPGVGYYGVDQTRTYECDGWGTLNIYDQSFQTLRVRSVVNATDSLFTTLFGNTGFGFSFPRPESITYEWLSTEFIEPVLKITTAAGFVTQVQTADIYEEIISVNETQKTSQHLFPNPCLNEIRIEGLETKTEITIYSQEGKMIKQTMVLPGNSVDVSELASGSYLVTLRNGTNTRLEKLVKE